MSMIFLKVSSAAPAIENVVAAIAAGLDADLWVLWLVSGGSLVPAEVSVMQQLATITDCRKLTVMQIDERYGPVDHTDSNWRKLLAAGFAPGKAQVQPVLRGLDFEATVKSYDQLLANALRTNDVCIGMFGMGADGHTAGILPNSPAADPTVQTVVGYQGPDFQRITMTFSAIMQLSQAVVYAMGSEKATALDNLSRELSLSEQPAQVFKQLPRVYVYNDHKGDTA